MSCGSDELPGFVREHSEDERRRILDELEQLFARVEDYQRRTAQPLAPSRGSLLEAADALSDPFQASHAVNQLLTNAADHLHALRELFVTAQAQHIYAPYTLIRSALENAATVLFMLRDATPQSAAFEALRYEWGNIKDQHTAALTIGMSSAAADESKQNRADLLDKAIVRSGHRPDRVKGSPKSVSKMLEAVTDAYRLGPLPHSMWQLCSAATHGKRWAIPMLAMMSSVDRERQGTLVGRLESDEASIRNALWCACHLLERALTVREKHSRPSGHTGASFFSIQPQRSPAVVSADQWPMLAPPSIGMIAPEM